jgi:mRNA interferase ChpB
MERAKASGFRSVVTKTSGKRGVANQGDIYRVALDPTAGTEIRGTRLVLILSNADFNSGGRAFVAPITQGSNFERVAGWAVTLMGSGTAMQGAAVISQCRLLDLKARAATKIEASPQEVVDEALAKLQAMVE